MKSTKSLFLPAFVLLASGGSPTFACSTCFGDPDSAMVKGAVMGVYVLVGIVSFVLAGIAGTGLFWIHRSRLVAAEEGGDPAVQDRADRGYSPRRGAGM